MSDDSKLSRDQDVKRGVGWVESFPTRINGNLILLVVKMHYALCLPQCLNGATPDFLLLPLSLSVSLSLSFPFFASDDADTGTVTALTSKDPVEDLEGSLRLGASDASTPSRGQIISFISPPSSSLHRLFSLCFEVKSSHGLRIDLVSAVHPNPKMSHATKLTAVERWALSRMSWVALPFPCRDRVARPTFVATRVDTSAPPNGGLPFLLRPCSCAKYKYKGQLFQSFVLLSPTCLSRFAICWLWFFNTRAFFAFLLLANWSS